LDTTISGTGVKQALTVGCGSGNGKTIVDTLLANDYVVTNIGSSQHPGCNNITIEWHDLELTNLHKIYRPGSCRIDFVFFNQNASSLETSAFDPNQNNLQVWKLIKNWQHTHWISCQLPILLLHYLGKNLVASSKVGWMLSSMMCYDCPGTESYPDYSSQKYFNYLAMKCFSEHYQTFGIMPDFTLAGSERQLADILIQVCTRQVNAEIFKM
jgi:hypothetical protein